MKEKILILDTHIGNIQSVANVLEHLGINFMISNSREELSVADRVIFPGVGTYGNAMEKIKRQELVEPMKVALLKDKKPFLGICVGMQVLSDMGHEFGEHQGLGVVAGTVKKLQERENLKLPHIGWNNIKKKTESSLLKNIPDEASFYFLHSYHFIPNNPNVISSSAFYGEEVAASIEQENIFGVQFHAEKSQTYGIQLLKNFLEL